MHWPCMPFGLDRTVICRAIHPHFLLAVVRIKRTLFFTFLFFSRPPAYLHHKLRHDFTQANKTPIPLFHFFYTHKIIFATEAKNISEKTNYLLSLHRLLMRGQNFHLFRNL
jgi:hypothetical protein